MNTFHIRPHRYGFIIKCSNGVFHRTLRLRQEEVLTYTNNALISKSKFGNSGNFPHNLNIRHLLDTCFAYQTNSYWLALIQSPYSNIVMTRMQT